MEAGKLYKTDVQLRSSHVCGHMIPPCSPDIFYDFLTSYNISSAWTLTPWWCRETRFTPHPLAPGDRIWKVTAIRYHWVVTTWRYTVYTVYTARGGRCRLPLASMSIVSRWEAWHLLSCFSLHSGTLLKKHCPLHTLSQSLLEHIPLSEPLQIIFHRAQLHRKPVAARAWSHFLLPSLLFDSSITYAVHFRF